ncbi:MAG: TSUP family transporter [Candidatus Sericytochromatia bacterium]
MFLLQFFSDYTILLWISLATLAFIAGFLDAVVGGGGLIQIPALLINFPNLPLATIFGTNKIASFSGTSISAYQYAKKIKFDYKLLAIISFFAFISSFSGAKIVSFLDVNKLKPIILIILIIIAFYTYNKKNLGAIQTKELTKKKQIIYGSLIGFIIGFYDGFFGPGTGSFFVLAFVTILGLEFVTASAYSKIINCITNLSALIVFINQKTYLINIAIIMAIFNMIGNFLGSKIALKKGNNFVRRIFLVVVSLMILRYGYDIFTHYF